MQIYIKVTNKNEFPIKDSYDGIEYVMMPAPAQPTSLPFHVAAHFFGLNTPEDIEAKDKINYFIMKRWGWNRPEIGNERAKELCDNISFSSAVYEMREVETSDEYLAAPRVDSSVSEPSESHDEKPKRKGWPGFGVSKSSQDAA